MVTQMVNKVTLVFQLPLYGGLSHFEMVSLNVYQTTDSSLFCMSSIAKQRIPFNCQCHWCDLFAINWLMKLYNFIMVLGFKHGKFFGYEFSLFTKLKMEQFECFKNITIKKTRSEKRAY